MDKNNNLNSIQELIYIMGQLRSKDGCQWDRQQTPQSLKKHILEEAYELLEAIDSDNPTEICDELGDLLLQVVFQAQIFTESGQFNISDVAQTISDKLKRRHPHIFSNSCPEGHEQRWDEIKRQERSERGKSNSLAHRIPAILPALKRATKLTTKRPRTEPLNTIQQLQNQLQAVEAELRSRDDDTSRLDNMLSQILFDVCQLAAAIDLDPEDLLRKKVTRVISEIDEKNNL